MFSNQTKILDKINKVFVSHALDITIEYTHNNLTLNINKGTYDWSYGTFLSTHVKPLLEFYPIDFSTDRIVISKVKNLKEFYAILEKL